MKQIYFIGAGPGDPELITLKAAKIIKKADCIIYAGSLIPLEILEHAKKGSLSIDSSSMVLEEIIDTMAEHFNQGRDVVRLHSGDLSLYSAVNEQCQALAKLQIPYTLIPGIPTFAAASAALALEFTVPKKSQSIVLTRYPGKTGAMPPGDNLAHHVKSNSTVIIHLAITAVKKIARELAPILGASYKIAVLYRIGWADEKIIMANFDNISEKVKANGITRQAIIVISEALQKPVDERSKLYSGEHSHLFRKIKKLQKT